STRRHTRFSRDWSSDVCSSDLTIDLHLEKEKLHARLAWCYGDLSMANALIHCGKALQNENVKNKGVEVALKTMHRTLENSGCVRSEERRVGKGRVMRRWGSRK